MTAADPTTPQSEAALEKLCRTYWPPVYAFIRRHSPSPADALDSTQEFFARFLKKEQVRLADPERGRLRSFLLISIKSFLTNEWAYAQAAKRGGGRTIQSLEESLESESALLARIPDPAATPDQSYEKQWAFTLLDHTLGVLRQQIFTSDGLAQFDALKGFIWGGPPKVSQVEVAAQLGMTANAMGVAVHRLRRRYGELLREAVGRTVANASEVDGELRHLIAVISS
jgi:RNA polymerase sigma-70 factor (ECF subfamily)